MARNGLHRLHCVPGHPKSAAGSIPAEATNGAPWLTPSVTQTGPRERSPHIKGCGQGSNTPSRGTLSHPPTEGNRRQ